MSTRFRFGLIGLCALLVGFAPPALAQDSDSIAIAPPPLAYPDYAEPGKKQERFTGTFITGSVGDIDLTGLGISLSSRAILPPAETGEGRALGISTGVFVLEGSSDTVDLSAVNVALGGNFEAEVFKQEGNNGILFVGPLFTFGYTGVSAPGFTADTTMFLLGFQVGGQVSIAAGDYKVSPWVSYSQQSGDADTTVSTPFGTTTTTTSIEIVTTSYGFDVLHLQSGLTLSGIMQAGSGDSDSDLLILQLSYSYGDGTATATDVSMKRQ